MLKEEFISRTGWEPSEEEFKIIHECYLNGVYEILEDFPCKVWCSTREERDRMIDYLNGNISASDKSSLLRRKAPFGIILYSTRTIRFEMTKKAFRSCAIPEHSVDYFTGSMDKDDFCREWKKKGVQELMKYRGRKISELYSKLEEKTKDAAECEKENIQLSSVLEKYKKIVGAPEISKDIIHMTVKVLKLHQISLCEEILLNSPLILIQKKSEDEYSFLCTEEEKTWIENALKSSNIYVYILKE